MIVEEVYRCSTCDKSFDSKEECVEHEKHCIPFMTVYCYLISNAGYDIPSAEGEIKYRFLSFHRAKMYEKDGCILLWEGKENDDGYFYEGKPDYISNCIRNKDDITNNKVFDNGRYIYIFSFEDSPEIREKCVKKLVEYKIESLLKEKLKIEEKINLYKNCFSIKEK